MCSLRSLYMHRRCQTNFSSLIILEKAFLHSVHVDLHVYLLRMHAACACWTTYSLVS